MACQPANHFKQIAIFNPQWLIAGKLRYK